MATALELALEALPHFAKNVVAGSVRSYGVYAAAIGRNPAKESIVIGKAMHAIGAACIFTAIPVAPLYYVEGSDRERRSIFESDDREAALVLPHYKLLFVTAREYNYSDADFARIDKALRTVLPKHFPSESLSPHPMWHAAFDTKFKDGTSFFERAMSKYRELFEAMKSGNR